MRRLLAVLLLTAVVVTGSASAKASVAAAPTPSIWQQSAVGLKTTQNAGKKTAGLTFAVQDKGWPFLSLQGGVKQYSGKLVSANGIELGLVKVPGVTGALSGETADWAHDQLIFNSSQLTLWVSRLSPAILVQSQSSTLRFFAGPVSGNTLSGTTVAARNPAPSSPKYVAYDDGNAVQVRPLSSTDTVLPPAVRWMLVWYGGKSHFVETKKPLTYSDDYAGFQAASLPQQYAYQADAPVLLVFQTSPTVVRQSIEGGLDVGYGVPAGAVAMVSLFGREHPRAADTEAWSAGVPVGVVNRARFWASRLCQYPLTAAESYSYDPATDTASVTESFSYQSVCGGGATYAPVPPALGIAKDRLAVGFSAAVVDGNLPTEFGPTLGIDNATGYTWSIRGLKKYAEGRRVATLSSAAPSDLVQQLAAQVDGMVAAGHFAPWIFTDQIPARDTYGDIYWLSPADTIYHLAEIVPALPEPQKTRLIGYLRAERTAYPPEMVYNLPLGAGVRRSFQLPGDTIFPGSSQTIFNRWTQSRADVLRSRTSLYDFYALARYYEATGDALPGTVLSAALTALDNDMREQDWASFYWFKGSGERRVAVETANRHFAGLVGLVRLAKRSGDTPTEQLARALLAKAAVARVAMAAYPRYLYAAGLVELPLERDWQPRYSAGTWVGHLYDYNWVGALDDPRQVVSLDQFGLLLYDHTGVMEPGTGSRDIVLVASSHLSAFRDMAPELGRLLSDVARPDADAYVAKATALYPHWYAAFAEATLGVEHNLAHPSDSFQVFMAKALIDQEKPDLLSRYVDVPWNSQGDLFYMQKLAETIKAYSGMSWVDVP